MNLPEPLDVLNKRLLDTYGYFESTPLAKFRVVWSEEQFEGRIGPHSKYTEAGLYLGEENGFFRSRKYHTFREKYVLEEVTPLPDDSGLIGKLSYEPRWVFGKGGDPNGESVPPTWAVLQFVCNTILRSRETKLPTDNREETLEDKEERLAKLVKELWPNETEVGDALAYREGVAGFYSKLRTENELPKSES